MRKKLDLTGQRFGRLTVVSELPKEGASHRWYCVCDCGNSRVTTTATLRSGKCNSCGCLHNEYLAKRRSKTDTDITGIRVGKLVALKKVKVEGYRSIMWLCQCDCGEQTTVPAFKLKKGIVRSCGCLITENMSSFFEAGTNIPALMANTLSSRNTSGTKGVHFVSSRNKWSANITFQGKRYWLGRYTDKEGAINARKEAEARLHGDFLDWYNSREEDSNKE